MGLIRSSQTLTCTTPAASATAVPHQGQRQAAVASKVGAPASHIAPAPTRRGDHTLPHGPLPGWHAGRRADAGELGAFRQGLAVPTLIEDERSRAVSCAALRRCTPLVLKNEERTNLRLGAECAMDRYVADDALRATQPSASHQARPPRRAFLCLETGHDPLRYPGAHHLHDTAFPPRRSKTLCRGETLAAKAG